VMHELAPPIDVHSLVLAITETIRIQKDSISVKSVVVQRALLGTFECYSIISRMLGLDQSFRWVVLEREWQL
jgi:hypothetical protein